MPSYKLLFLDGLIVRNALAFLCEDDREAIDTVSQHEDGRAMELWQGSRLVKSFDSQEPPASS